MDIKDWFSFEGSLSKNEYIKRALISILAPFVLAWIPVLGWLACLALFVVLVFSVIRRLNALGKSPWLALLLIVPLVGLGLIIYLMIKD